MKPDPCPPRVPGTARVVLLGGFEFRLDGVLVPLATGEQRLIGLLAVRDRPQTRATVASTLWPDGSDQRAAANLRTTLWRLRRMRQPVVRTNGRYVALDEGLEVDVSRLFAQARRLTGSHPELDESDMRAETLVGDLLPDWDEEWLLFERERIRQLSVHALEALCERLTRDGRLAEAVDVGQVAVAAEPLRESAHARLIAAHLAEGNVAEAVRQYQLLKALLLDGIGVEPSQQLGQLVTSVTVSAGCGHLAMGGHSLPASSY
jgi:DNA-binding SARP family transcriptional activator